MSALGLLTRSRSRVRRDYRNRYRTLYRRISASAARKARQLGAVYEVSGEIHPDDFMFWALRDSDGSADEAAAVAQYFESGRSTAVQIKSILDEFLPDREVDILEFAAGYARVTRHFPAIWPQARVVASDIHQKAVDFAGRINLPSVISTWEPQAYDAGGPYDAIVAISFFTHIPKDRWPGWLEALRRQLKPDGVILFTTHGHAALQSMGIREAPDDGFLFIRVSEQKDLDVDKYGSTVTLPHFVEPAIAQAGLKLASRREPGLGVQDLYIVQRDDAPRPS